MLGLQSRKFVPAGVTWQPSGPVSDRGVWRAMRPYARQVAGLLSVGSLCGLLMNTAVVLPAVLLGQPWTPCWRTSAVRPTEPR